MEIETSNLVDRLIVAIVGDKSSLKEACSGHMNHLNFGGTSHISGTAEATVIKFCILVGHIKSQHTDNKSPLKRGMVRIT